MAGAANVRSKLCKSATADAQHHHKQERLKGVESANEKGRKGIRRWGGGGAL